MTTAHETSAHKKASVTLRERAAHGLKLSATLLGTSLLLAACSGGGSTYVAGRYDNGDDYVLPTKDTLFDAEGRALCGTATVYEPVESRASAERAAMSFVFEALNNEPDPAADLSSFGDDRAIENEARRRELMQNSLEALYQATHPLLFDADKGISSATDLATAKAEISRALGGAYGSSAPASAYLSVGEGAALVTEGGIYKLENVVVPLNFLADEMNISGYTLQDTLKVTVKKATDENGKIWALIREKEGTGIKLQNGKDTIVPESAEFVEEFDVNVDLLYMVTLFERGDIVVEEEPTVEPSPSADETATEEPSPEASPEPSPTEEPEAPAVEDDELPVTAEYVTEVEAYVLNNKIDITINTTTYNYEKATIKAGPIFIVYLMEENKSTGEVKLYDRDGGFVPNRATYATEEQLASGEKVKDETPEVKINLLGDGCPDVGKTAYERFWVTGYSIN